MTPRFFNKTKDILKLNNHLDKVKNRLEVLVDLPTHSHYLASILLKEAMNYPALSKTSRKRLKDISVAVITQKYRDLCYNGLGQPTDVVTELIKEYGHDVEAQRALIWAAKQKPYWRFWIKRIEHACRAHYPEIKEEEWG